MYLIEMITKIIVENKMQNNKNKNENKE